MSKHYTLLIALIAGGILGSLLFPYQDVTWLKFINENILQFFGQLFLKLIFMIVVPMVVSALILGVYELARNQGFGSVAKKTLMYTIIASSMSVIIGITLVNVLKPGVGLNVQNFSADQSSSLVTKIQGQAKEAKSVKDTLLDLVPSNPIMAASNALSGEMLALMVFSLIFGIAYAHFLNNNSGREPALLPLLEDIYGVSMKIVDYALKLAPFAVFAIIFNTCFKMGPYFLTSLLQFVLCVVLGLLIQQFVVYTLLLKFVAKKAPLKFFKDCREVYLYAFSTASSNATLPRALQTAEYKLKLSPRISRFVLTVGSTANQNGTALFEGVTVLFLAQVYGINLTLSSQVLVVLISILAGIGTAGVPGGSLPVIMVLLESVGVPPQGLGIILGVDRFLDMCRTTLNVSGDLVIAALVDEPQK